jgi:DNA replication protein DnaC
VSCFRGPKYCLALPNQRNLVFIGGTGTGKTHLAIAVARSCIRSLSRGRFFTTVDLVNQLEAEARVGRQGRIADYLTRLDFVILDELGYLLSLSPGDNCYSISSARSMSAPQSSSPPTSPSASGRACSAIRR